MPVGLPSLVSCHRLAATDNHLWIISIFLPGLSRKSVSLLFEQTSSQTEPSARLWHTFNIKFTPSAPWYCRALQCMKNTYGASIPPHQKWLRYQIKFQLPLSSCDSLIHYTYKSYMICYGPICLCLLLLKSGYGRSPQRQGCHPVQQTIYVFSFIFD